MPYLKEYNEQEIFYQKYQQRKREKTLQFFLKNYNKNDLMHKQVYVEEFLLTGHKEFEKEEVMWSDQQKDIEIRKYNRFMPQLFAIHDFFEMIYVLENEMHLEVEEDKMSLEVGDIVLIPPDTIHRPIVMENTIAIQVIIRKSTFQKVFYKLLNGNNVISEFFLNALYIKDVKNILIFNCQQDKDVLNCLLQLFQEDYNQLPGNRIVVNNLFEILLCLLLRFNLIHMKVSQKRQPYDKRAIQILQYIQEYSEYVTIKEVAKTFNLSESYLSKYIIRKIGKSFSELRQEIRMEKACEMLRGSNLQVADIALFVGYENVEHFIRLFKKKYEQTPNQYRKNIQK